MIKIIPKFETYLTLIRPLAAVPFLFALFFGQVFGGFKRPLDALNLILIYDFLIFGSLHTFNLWSDQDVDILSKGGKDIILNRQPFVSGRIGQKKGLLFGLALMTSGLLLLVFFYQRVFIVSLAEIIIGLLYSLPPRFKGKKFLDVISNAAGAFLAFLAGYFLFQRNLPLSTALPLAWISLLVGSTYLLTVMEDIEADRRAGLKTTAVSLGRKRTTNLSFFFYIFSFPFLVAALLIHFSPSFLTVALFYLPGIARFVKLIGRGTLKDNQRMVELVAKSALLAGVVCFLEETALRFFDKIP